MLFILAIHVKLSDVIYAQFFLLQLDFVGVGSKFGCEISNMVRKGGREENDLNAFPREKAREN